MSVIPPLPDSPPDGSATSSVVMRYEDLAQDGRVLVESLATSVNEALWRHALRGHALEAHAFAKGTLAILTRFAVEGGDGPFSVDGPFEADARFVLAHGTSPGGDVDRIYLNAWVDTYAPIARTNFPPPPNAGERALVGRTFSEHVFTRPFAPPSERKVTRLDVPGLAAVPASRYAPLPPASLLETPADARTIDETLEADSFPIVFGLRHTDSNQHVNSLVYPQLFEEAALRRLAQHGIDTGRLARSLEVAYRKPCFAGQTVQIALALSEHEGRIAASGGFYLADDLRRLGVARAVPHAFVRLTLDTAAR